MKRFYFVLIIWIVVTIIGAILKIYNIDFANVVLVVSVVLMIVGIYLFFSNSEKK